MKTVRAAAPIHDAPAESRATGRVRRLINRPVVAVAVLLAVYVLLSFINDPHGFLGTDTGGKVATLRVMAARHHFDPNLGYWAERWDPMGTLHPIFYTYHLGHRWVNVTTLPALYVGEVLFRLGGYRAALLVPELGSILAALAARAMARRLGCAEGWAAFWVIGLASPLTIYALDFWEHSLGVALIAWGLVVLFDIYANSRPWYWGGVAGLLFGLAATMRTEALAYGAIATGVVCGCLLLWPRSRSGNRDRRWHWPSWLQRNPAASDPFDVLLTRAGMAIAVGAAVAVGLLIPLRANTALERATMGSTLRSERVAGTASAAGTASGVRAKEALTTAVGLLGDLSVRADVVGIALLALLLIVAWRSTRSRDRRIVAVAAAGVIVLYAIRASSGLGFIPGLIPAASLSVVGLAWGWKDWSRRLVGSVALGTLPVVWAFQFPGGALPQWGGRYILTSGLLLTVLGIVELPRLAKWAQLFFVALAVAATGFGVAWLSVRSHEMAHAQRALDHRPEPVLVSYVAHLVREGGAYYGTPGDRRWLTAVTTADLNRAGDVLRLANVDSFGLVQLTGQPVPDQIGTYRRVGRSSLIKLFSGIYLRVTTYQEA